MALWFKPLEKDLATVLKCPLAGWCLFVQIFTFCMNSWNLIQVINIKYRFLGHEEVRGYIGAEDATLMFFISLLLAINICGTMGILWRWKFGMRTIGIGYRIILTSYCVELIATIFVSFFTLCGVGGGTWHVLSERIEEEKWLLLLQMISISMWWYALSGIKSLQHVIAYGGSGWEKLNYVDIRNLRRTEAYLDIIAR